MTKLNVPAHTHCCYGYLFPTRIRNTTHQHSLKLVPHDHMQFECNGCKLHGTGRRYECRRGCDFHLHTGCALALPKRRIGDYRFVLLPKPDGRRVCNVCGHGVRGLVYHCSELDLDVHPCCADLLRDRIPLSPDVSFELRMEAPPRRCVLCEYSNNNVQGSHRHCRTRDAWSYSCNIGDGGKPVSLHVTCAADVLPFIGSFTVPLEVAYHRAVSYASQTTAVGHIKVSDDVYRRAHGGEGVVPVSGTALTALLLRGRRANSRGGRLKRSLRVLGFIVRVVLSVIIGDPTTMIATIVGTIFSH